MAETTLPLQCSLRASADTHECSAFRKARLGAALFPKVTKTHMWRSSVLLLAPGTRPLQRRPLESHGRAWLSRATLGSPFRGLTQASHHLPGHHSTGRCCGTLPASHDVMKLLLDKEGSSLQYLYSGLQNTFAGDLFWKLPNQRKWGQRGSYRCPRRSQGFSLLWRLHWLSLRHHSCMGACTGPPLMPSRHQSCDEVWRVEETPPSWPRIRRAFFKLQSKHHQQILPIWGSMTNGAPYVSATAYNHV